jgi:hypothetical protein
VDNNTCFGCIGNLDQTDIQQTKVLSIDIDQTVEPSRTEKSQQRRENTDIIGTNNTQTNIVITTEQIQPEPIPNTEDHKISTSCASIDGILFLYFLYVFIIKFFLPL